jgi:GLPGLI family protein
MGPDVYTGLPGLILAIDIDDKNVILATSVDLTPPQESNLVKPKEGKKISQKEFDQILAEKEAEWKEVQENRGSRDRRD